MDFDFSPAERDLADLAARVAREVVAPRAAAVDETEAYPQDYFDAFRDSDLLGVAVPEEYGGAGLGCLGLVLAVEAVARLDCSAGLMLLLTRLPLMPILLGGSDEQKRRYGGGIASGSLRGSFCLSEPGAGSDVQGLRTRATRRGDRYMLEGTKAWISGAGEADFFTVAARTDPDLPATRGTAMFVVERSAPGLSVAKRERKLGVRGIGVHQVIFDGVEVEASARLGSESGGFSLVMQTLNAVRPVVAARGIGLAEGALTYWLGFAADRKTFGQPLIEHQGLRWRAAELAADIEACRLLTYRAAQMVDRGRVGRDAAPFLSMAKMRATELAVRASNECLQMMGAVGFMEDYPMARMMRDARQLTIVEGTSEIQREIIGRALRDGLVSW